MDGPRAVHSTIEPIRVRKRLTPTARFPCALLRFRSALLCGSFLFGGSFLCGLLRSFLLSGSLLGRLFRRSLLLGRSFFGWLLCGLFLFGRSLLGRGFLGWFLRRSAATTAGGRCGLTPGFFADDLFFFVFLFVFFIVEGLAIGTVSVVIHLVFSTAIERLIKCHVLVLLMVPDS